jgi:hypothetical protein
MKKTRIKKILNWPQDIYKQYSAADWYDGIDYVCLPSSHHICVMWLEKFGLKDTPEDNIKFCNMMIENTPIFQKLIKKYEKEISDELK